ncbi:secreted protein [Rhodopirellula baltica WH47]|uniref:Secreted protein n=2 Tax=Rhodopirellula baltica TaxID=265606 RepID=F2ANS2_RHOBT|nr:secreted protein [Rhodopirellula baltica WH47]
MNLMSPTFGHCRFRITLALFAAMLGQSVNPTAVFAQQPPEQLTEFLELNCTYCHDADTREGDLDLDSLTLELLRQSSKTTCP